MPCQSKGLKWSRGVLVGLLSVAFSLSLPCLRYMTQGGFGTFIRHSSPDSEYPNRLGFFLMLLPQSLAAVSAALLYPLRHRSVHLWDSTVYALLLWSTASICILRYVNGTERSYERWLQVDVVLYPILCVFRQTVLVCKFRLLYKRAASIRKPPLWAMDCIFWLMATSIVAATVWLFVFNWNRNMGLLMGQANGDLGRLWSWLIRIFTYIDRFARYLALAWCLYILVSPLRQFRIASDALGPKVWHHMSWAVYEGRLQFLGALLCCASGLVDEVVRSQTLKLKLFSSSFGWKRESLDERSLIFHILARMIDLSLQSIGAFLLSGAASAGEYAWKPRQAQQVEVEAMVEHAEYRRKVSDLASRGITVEDLLDFYRYLSSPQSCMAFAADSHTTNDVVRQAIIPLTKASGQCYASLVGAQAPAKFVTHNWANLFRHLLAAVLSDALGEAEFFPVACLLDGNIDHLEQLLHEKGALRRAYWICAFSVAQHVSICDAPHGVDSVSKMPYPPCDCGRLKALNDTPPTLDGRSIPCEMNKFQDMIRYLATDHFEGQVVAIDCDFGLFQRCWCVAEVAEVHRLGLRQELKVESRRLLAEKQPLLRNLKIEKMQGAREEDVKEILDAIPDKAAFNRHLQDIFFDEHYGLITQWRAPDSASALKDIGRISRMLSACARADHSSRCGRWVESGEETSSSSSS